jgi:hypothetical protein
MYIGNPIYQVAFLTDQFSGNGGTTFTMSVAPANTASVLVAVSGVLQDPSTYSVVGTTLTFSSAPPVGTGNISARYLGIPASNVTTTAYRTVTEFTATASQTTFTPPSYTVGFINVYRNGVRLGSADYTATNGTTVVLASGAASGDLVAIESFLVSSVLNAIPNTAGSVGTTNLASNLTLSGTTTVQTGIIFAANPGGGTQATLNDYETGTWTPTLTAGTGSFTLSTTSGSYTKIGNMVTVNMLINFASTSSASNVTITNLPFSQASGNSSSGILRENAITGYFWGLSAGSGTSIIFWRYDNSNTLPSGTPHFTGSFTYLSAV